MHITTTKESLFALALIEKATAEVVYLNISVDHFNKNTAEETVLFLLYSELLQSGSGPYSRDEFQQACDALGTKISVGTSNGIVSISLTSLFSKVNPSLRLLEQLLISPSFKPNELKRAVRTLKNSLELSRENARSISHTLLKNSLLEEDSRQFGFLPDQLLKAVDKITVAHIKNLHREIMLAYWTISVGGNKKSLTAGVKTIKRIKNSSTTLSSVITKAKVIKKRIIVLHEVKSKQNIELSIGGLIPFKLHDTDTTAFMFGLAVLGKWGGFSGRLMSTVREKEGLTYGIYAKVEGITQSETGYWRIMTFFAPKDVVKGITSTLREINSIANKGITDGELGQFKTILKTSESLMFDSLAGTVDLVHSNLASGLTWDEYQTFRASFQKLTKVKINQVLKKYLRPEALCISAAGPIASVKSDIQKFAK